MALPANILQNVETYNKAQLGVLINMCPMFYNANKKFNDFQTIPGQKGKTVTFDRPPRFKGTPSLVATFEPTEQEKISLTIDGEYSVATAYNIEQIIYNVGTHGNQGDVKTVDEYLTTVGISAMKEMASHLEADISEVAETSTYRYYGDGTTPINSLEKLSDALALFREYGAVKTGTKAFLPNRSIPPVVAQALTQFATARNDKMANSWDIGPYDECEFHRSNLLPRHIAGSVGNTPHTLTVTGVTTDPDGGISAITCSGASDDANAIKAYDLLRFNDGVGSFTDVRYLSWVGHHPVDVPVQIKATADAASVGDSVTISIFPKLYSASGNKQNLSTPIVNGMQLSAVPTHRCGLIWAGNPLFVANPRLPDESPYETIRTQDSQTGAFLRMYWGAKFGENQHGTCYDMIWGKTLMPEYSMRLVYPD